MVVWCRVDRGEPRGKLDGETTKQKDKRTQKRIFTSTGSSLPIPELEAGIPGKTGTVVVDLAVPSQRLKKNMTSNAAGAADQLGRLTYPPGRNAAGGPPAYPVGGAPP